MSLQRVLVGPNQLFRNILGALPIGSLHRTVCFKLDNLILAFQGDACDMASWLAA